MKEGPVKIHLNCSTYVTKVNGKLVTVRKKSESLRNICLDLLGEAFGKCSRPKMKDDSTGLEGEKAPAQNPTATPLPSILTPTFFNPNANVLGLAPVQPVMGPTGQQPGIYRFGNRQLALLPLNPLGGSAIPPQMAHTYAQPPWTFPQTSNMNGLNFSPRSTDQGQFVTNSVPPVEISSSTTETKHICAECGRLRSRKYHLENPLKPGETPPPAFCKKCQKDVTSTEESDISIGNTEKRHQRSKKGHKKKTENQTDASKESGGSCKPRKASKIKQNKAENRAMNESIALEEHEATIRNRNQRTHLYDEEDFSNNRNQASPSPEKEYLRGSRFTNLSQGHDIDSLVIQSRGSHQAQRSSRENVLADGVGQSHYSRREPSPSTYETYETDRVSEQSRSNEDSASSETMPRRESSLELPISSTLRTRSDEVSRRRRLERSIDRQGLHPEATRLSQVIYPGDDDEVVVVTERYVYRPRQPSHAREGDVQFRRQITRDKATIETEGVYSQFASKTEALEYYQNDWPGAGELSKAGHEKARPRSPEDLMGPINSHNSDTISSSHQKPANTDEYRLPRAPSPPIPRRQGGLRVQIDLSSKKASRPPSEAETLPLLENERHKLTRDQNVTARRSNRDNYRPPYVREATDKGTEKAIIMPSPKHPHEILFYPDTDESETTEEIERVERHVTFRDAGGYEDGPYLWSEKIGPARARRDEGRRS